MFIIKPKVEFVKQKLLFFSAPDRKPTIRICHAGAADGVQYRPPHVSKLHSSLNSLHS